MLDVRWQVSGGRWEVAGGGREGILHVPGACCLCGMWQMAACVRLLGSWLQTALNQNNAGSTRIATHYIPPHAPSFDPPPPFPCIAYAGGEAQLERLKPVANRSDSSQHSTCNVQRATRSLIRVNTRSSRLQARDWGNGGEAWQQTAH